MGRPRKSEKNSINLKLVLASDGFQEVIKFLESEHPMKRELVTSSTMEQRALYQIQCQEYERFLIKLRAMSTNARKESLVATYEPSNKE